MRKTDIKTFAKLFILEEGKPIQLEKWQLKRIVEPVFYTLNPDGTRKFNLALAGLPKKNGKSTLAALVASYMLLGDGEPEPEVFGAAGGKEQARIIFSQTKRAIERSPILYNEVKIYRDVIERRDGRGFYRVLSADAPLQHGLNPHCVLWDELWNQRSYDLWEALTHSPARKQPLHWIVTYAGYRPWEGDLCFDLYTAGKEGKDPRTYFYWANKNFASWVTKDYLKQQRLRLPEHIYKRLHRNEWTTGSGTFLSQADVNAAIDPELSQRFKGEPTKHYHLALDLGLRRDRTAMAVCHGGDNGVVLDYLRLWKAPKGGELRIEDIEEELISITDRFRVTKIIFDPWQSIRTRQLLEDRGFPVEEFIFSGGNITKLTQNLLSLFKDRQIRIFDHPELVKELLSVKIVERSYGARISHDSGAHDDTVVALGMAALQAVKRSERLFPDSVFGNYTYRGAENARA